MCETYCTLPITVYDSRDSLFIFPQFMDVSSIDYYLYLKFIGSEISQAANLAGPNYIVDIVPNTPFPWASFLTPSQVTNGGQGFVTVDGRKIQGSLFCIPSAQLTDLEFGVRVIYIGGSGLPGVTYSINLTEDQ